MSESKGKKYPLYPVYTINFIGSLGFSIVVPFLVFLNNEFGGNALIFGLLGGMYPLMQIFGAPWLGKLSDKIGRKKVLIMSQAGTLACWGLYIVAVIVPIIPLFSVGGGQAPDGFTMTLPLLLLFIARGLDGLTGGNISVANSYIADVTPKNQLTNKLGTMALAYNLGFVGGPIIGGVLGSILAGSAAVAATPPILAAFVISIFGMFVVFKLRPSPKFDKEHVEVQTNLGTYTQPTDHVAVVVESKERHIKDFWKIPQVSFILVIYFVSFFALNLQSINIPLHFQGSLGWNALEVGIFFAISSVVMMIVQGPVLRRMTGKVSDRWIAVMGNIALATSCVFLFLRDDYWLFAAALSLGVGQGWIMPSLQSVISKLAGSELQGTAQGAIASAGALAGTVGYMAGGAIYGFIGDSVFLIAAGIAGVAFMMSFGIKKVE